MFKLSYSEMLINNNNLLYLLNSKVHFQQKTTVKIIASLLKISLEMTSSLKLNIQCKITNC